MRTAAKAAVSHGRVLELDCAGGPVILALQFVSRCYSAKAGAVS